MGQDLASHYALLLCLNDDWIRFYNTERPHSTLGGRTPNEAYDGQPMTVQPLAAA